MVELETLKQIGSMATNIVAVVMLGLLAYLDPSVRDWAIIAFAGLLGVSLAGTTIGAARVKATTLSTEALRVLVTQAISAALVDLPDAIAKVSNTTGAKPDATPSAKPA